MRLDFLPIYKRELRAMLQSWGLYVSLALFFFISALFFDLNLMTFIQESAEQAQQPYAAINNPLNFNESVVVNTFGVMAFLFIFIVPLLTMRLLAEEKQTGTYELLATSPIFYNAALWSRGHREQVDEKREIIREAIQDRKDAGDTRAHLLTAADYHGGDVTDGAVDGGHPNDLGFARMAEGLRPKLAEILGITV